MEAMAIVIICALCMFAGFMGGGAYATTNAMNRIDRIDCNGEPIATYVTTSKSSNNQRYVVCADN